MLDPAARSMLEALQNPLRLEVHERLRAADGPLSVDTLAAMIQSSARYVGSALRKLSEVGLAHGYGTGGSQWVGTTTAVRIPDLADMDPADPDRLLVATLWRMMNERHAAKVTQWAKHGSEPRWSRWTDAAIGQEGFVIASPEQVRALEGDLIDVLKAFRLGRQQVHGQEAVWVGITAAPSAALRH